MRLWIEAVLLEFTRMTWQGWIVNLVGGCGLGCSYIHILVRSTRKVTAPLPGDGHDAMCTISTSVKSRGSVGGGRRLELPSQGAHGAVT
jgi:hypothetical protein